MNLNPTASAVASASLVTTTQGPEPTSPREEDPSSDPEPGPSCQPLAGSEQSPRSQDQTQVEILDHRPGHATRRREPIELEWLTSLAQASLARLQAMPAEISIILVDDAQIRAINAQHLGHDWETDVITFPLSEPGEPVLGGELIVSVETAARVAQQRDRRTIDELALYLVHGLLHLIGEDDATDSQRERMRRRESELLRGTGFAEPHEPGEIQALDRSIGEAQP